MTTIGYVLYTIHVGVLVVLSPILLIFYKIALGHIRLTEKARKRAQAQLASLQRV